MGQAISPIAVGATALALCLASPALSFGTANLTSESSASDIDLCVQQNFPDDSMVQTLRLVTKDRGGDERTLEARMFWQKDPKTGLSNVLLAFDAPPELRGGALLVLEKKPQNDMFMYVPELGKVRRITDRMVSGNMLGTDFTYDDFSRLQGMISNLRTERLADEQVAGRAAYVTLARPISGSDYDRIRSLIDRETCVPLRVEFYEKGGPEPVKLLTVDPAKVSEQKSHWIPRELQLENALAGTSTRLVIEKLEVSVPIDRKCFSVVELERQGRCRVLPNS